MFVLVAGLILTILHYHILLFGEPVRTTYIWFFNQNNYEITSDSFVQIWYTAGKEDKIDFFLQFRNLGQTKQGFLTIHYNGEMKKTDFGPGVLIGVTETSCEEFDDFTDRSYKLDFQSGQYALIYQQFLCNLFADRGGEARLDLSLINPLGYSYVCNEIPVHIRRLDSLKIEYVFPEPKRQEPHGMTYIYRSDDERFRNGITIKGNNPYLERKLLGTQFRFGVAIAILASLLGALGIEVAKDIKIGRI